MKAVTYSRVSNGQGNTQYQQGSAARYAEEHGYTVEAEYTDIAPGVTTERPGLDALRERVKAGDVDVVIVHSPDRLARSYDLLSGIQSQIEASGTRILYVRE